MDDSLKEDKVTLKLILMFFLGIIIAFIIVFIIGFEKQFNEKAAVNEMEQVLFNIDDNPWLSSYINNQTSLQTIQYVYKLKEDKAEKLAGILLRGICLADY